MLQHRVFVAMGSNLGSRASNMREAIWNMNRLTDTSVDATSFLYETGDVFSFSYVTFVAILVPTC